MATTEVGAGAEATRLVGTLSTGEEESRGSPAKGTSPVRYRTICVPLDGSAQSEEALALARSLGRRLESRLCLVHVHKPGSDRAYTGRAEYARRENEERCEESRYLWSKVEGAEREPTAASVLMAGRVPDALLRFVREQAMDLLVMTRYGSGGAGWPWLGSVADRVIRSTRVPLLLAPDPETPASARTAIFRRILVPLDGSGAAEEVLEHALALGEPCGASYTLVQVESPPPARVRSGMLPEAEEPAPAGQAAQRYLHYVAEQLRGRGVSVEVRVLVDARPASAILALAAEEQVDLIALTLHGEGGKQRRVLGSVSDKIVRAGRGALLLYRPRGGRVAPRVP